MPDNVRIEKLVVMQFQIGAEGVIYMGNKREKLVKKGERSDTYLTHVCRLPQSKESLEDVKKSGFHQL